MRALFDASLGECITTAAPVEKVVPLSPAILALLEDAFASEPVTRGFSSPKSRLDSCKLPEYPAASRRTEATGSTRLAFHIRADSTVIDGEVVKSAGSSPAHKLLDVTALFSLMQCKFEPARFRGEPLDAWTLIEYQWKLDE
jgi:TonB family protein